MSRRDPAPMRLRWRRLHLALLLLATARCGGTPEPPYPPSPVIAAVTFDWATRKRLAPGSDNWPLTWAADDRQYTSWGDGGGFSGTNDSCRVSLGFAAIDGTPSSFRGRDLWGDPRCADHPARFGGKTHTMVALGDTLYFWRSPGSNVSGLDYQRLYRSIDHAATWTDTGVEWTYRDHRIGFFAVLQYGRGYEGARDGFVYVYAARLASRVFDTQRPGELYLLRVPRGAIGDRSRYEFFTGTDGGGRPLWGPFERRAPVFRDPNGVMFQSAIYDRGLRRYLLVTNHTRSFRGNVALFDAPEPWGPWTTVLYATRWPPGRGADQGVFFANFSPKWWTDDGRRFVLVFTGTGRGDAFQSVEGSFGLTPSAGWQPRRTGVPRQR